MQKRQLIISILLTLLFLGIGGYVFNKLSTQKESTISDKKPVKETRTVEVATFPPTSVSNVIEIDGRVSAYEKINLAAEVQGRLIETGKTLKEGTSFSKGDLLFKIESKDDEFNLKAQRAQLLTSITQIMPDLKFDYPDAFPKWKKYLDDFNVDYSTPTLPTLGSDQERYFIGGKNIQNLYYTIKSQEERLKNYAVYAPFNGVFLSVNNYPGSLVSPGASLGQVMNTYQYEMISPIAEKNLRFVSTGQKVNLVSKETGKTFKGTVSRTGRQIDQTTQSIPLYISVSGTGLRDGMYLSGALNGSKVSGISIIPREALVNQTEVYLYQDGVLSTKSVEVQSIKEREAYVTGLAADDQVVVSSINNLYNGLQVKLAQ